MKINFNGDLSDISTILVSAERYALGRRTYIVSWTCRVIRDNMHLLLENDKQVIINDIKTALEYGNEIDKEDWMCLLKRLEGKKRNGKFIKGN